MVAYKHKQFLSRGKSGIPKKLTSTFLSKHKQHKGHFLKLFHVLKQHPASYRMGFKPSKGAVPKSIPTKMPAGYTKEAAGMFDWFKKRWSDVKKLFHKHKGKVVSAAKGYAEALGTRALHAAKDYAISRGTKIMSRGKAALDHHVNHYVSKAESKVKQVADRADKFIDKHTRLGVPSKKGSGIVARVMKSLR